MSLRIKKIKIRQCDRCHSNDEDESIFTEYPEGAGLFLGHRIDLCDRCVELNYVVFQGSIINEKEIQTTGMQNYEYK